MNKKIIASTLMLTLLGSSIHVNADEIDSLKSKIEETNVEKKQLEDKQLEVSHDMADLEAKIAKINTLIAETETKIQEAEAKIETLRLDIIETEEEIIRLEIELDKKKEILARNVKIMEQKGEASFLEFLFSSENMTDLLSRVSTLKDVAKANEELYQQVREQSETVKEKKKKLETQKKEQETQKKSLDSLKQAQKESKAEQQVLLEQMEKEYVHIESEINEQNAAIAAINNQISGIIAEREAARKAREAAAKEANSSNKNRVPGGNTPNTDSHTNDLIGSGFSNPMHPGTYYVSSNYGWRTHPITGKQKLHAGTDLAAGLGTPIYAADAGTVLYAGAATGFGHWVVIDHNNGYISVYGHSYGHQLYVSPGQQVSKGQHIAGVGSDGGSTGNHLHFEIHRGSLGNSLNPNSFIGF